MSEKSDLQKILDGKSLKKNSISKESKESISEILKIIQENTDFNPTLALVLILEKEFNNFEKKDIIPSSLAKAYALIGSTNKVQKDLITEIISKSNDKKGKVKEMYSKFILKTLESIKQNTDNEKESFLQKIGIKR